MHYCLKSSENWMRNKNLRACRAWESTYKKQNNHFWISGALVQGQIGLGHINPSVTSPNVSPRIVPNLAIIHRTWLKRMPSEWDQIKLSQVFLIQEHFSLLYIYAVYCMLRLFLYYEQILLIPALLFYFTSYIF